MFLLEKGREWRAGVCMLFALTALDLSHRPPPTCLATYDALVSTRGFSTGCAEAYGSVRRGRRRWARELQIRGARSLQASLVTHMHTHTHIHTPAHTCTHARTNIHTSALACRGRGTSTYSERTGDELAHAHTSSTLCTRLHSPLFPLPTIPPFILFHTYNSFSLQILYSQ